MDSMEDNDTISTTSNGQPSNNLQKLISSIEEFKKEVYKTNILLHYKTKVLQEDEYTLADYKVEKDSNLVIFKGAGYTEKEYVPTEEELNRGYATIREVFADNLYFDEEVMKTSIIKHKGNADEAAIFLTNPDNVIAFTEAILKVFPILKKYLNKDKNCECNN